MSTTLRYSLRFAIKRPSYQAGISRLVGLRWFSVVNKSPCKTPLEEYSRLVDIGKLRDDPYQKNVIGSLSKLYESLLEYNPPVLRNKNITVPKLSWKDKLISRFVKRSSALNSDISTIGNSIPRGIYLYGDVGCGKTMLMDLFFTTIPPHLSKTRIHFHQFMQGVHKRSHEIIQEYRKLNGDNAHEIDTIPFLANEIASKARVLCFDEFQVTDVADAMILRRLITTLMSNEFGVILFATSNRKPDDLYINGIQRESFIPCIELIKLRSEVIFLNSPTDYRKIPRPQSPVYYFPKNNLKYNSEKCAILRKNHINEWYEYFAQANHTDDSSTENTVHKTFLDYKLTVWGREFKVPKCTPPRIAQFTFKELCGEPLAAGDYLMLTRNFKAFIVTDIPYLSTNTRDEVRRFITFLDAVYDSGGKISTTSAADFNHLFVDPDMILHPFELKPTFKSKENQKLDSSDDELMKEHGFSKELAQMSDMFGLDEEKFAFARALSRLSQMSTTDWVSK